MARAVSGTANRKRREPPRPVLFDTTPRFQEFVVPPSPSPGSVLEALCMLRPMARARGYTSRDLVMRDVILFCSERWVHDMDRLAREFPSLKIQIVPAQVLVTEGAWCLTHGLDTVMSKGNW